MGKKDRKTKNKVVTETSNNDDLFASKKARQKSKPVDSQRKDEGVTSYKWIYYTSVVVALCAILASLYFQFNFDSKDTEVRTEFSEEKYDRTVKYAGESETESEVPKEKNGEASTVPKVNHVINQAALIPNDIPFDNDALVGSFRTSCDSEEKKVDDSLLAASDLYSDPETEHISFEKSDEKVPDKHDVQPTQQDGDVLKNEETELIQQDVDRSGEQEVESTQQGKEKMLDNDEVESTRQDEEKVVQDHGVESTQQYEEKVLEIHDGESSQQDEERGLEGQAVKSTPQDGEEELNQEIESTPEDGETELDQDFESTQQNAEKELDQETVLTPQDGEKELDQEIESTTQDGEKELDQEIESTPEDGETELDQDTVLTPKDGEKELDQEIESTRQDREKELDQGSESTTQDGDKVIAEQEVVSTLQEEANSWEEYDAESSPKDEGKVLAELEVVSTQQDEEKEVKKETEWTKQDENNAIGEQESASTEQGEAKVLQEEDVESPQQDEGEVSDQVLSTQQDGNVVLDKQVESTLQDEENEMEPETELTPQYENNVPLKKYEDKVLEKGEVASSQQDEDKISGGQETRSTQQDEEKVFGEEIIHTIGKDGIGVVPVTTDDTVGTLDDAAAAHKTKYDSFSQVKDFEQSIASMIVRIDQTSDDEGYFKVSSGVKKKIIREGTGKKVNRGDLLTMHCVGYLDGKQLEKFWSTRDPGQRPFTFAVGKRQVIKGWDEGAASMRLNELSRIKIEPEKAYGKHGFEAWGIPANCRIIFEIDLIRVKHTNEY